MSSVYLDHHPDDDQSMAIINDLELGGFQSDDPGDPNDHVIQGLQTFQYQQPPLESQHSQPSQQQQQLPGVALPTNMQGGIQFKTVLPPRNRKRILERKYKKRPCDGCRKRKAKCVFEPGHDDCTRCHDRNVSCTFLEELPSKRRLSSENRQGKQAESSISPGEESKKPKVRHSPNATAGSTLVGSPQSSDSDNGLLDSVPGDYAEFKGKSLLKRTLGLQNSRCSFLLGPTHVLDPTILQSQPYNQREESENCLPEGYRLRRADDRVYFLMEDDTKIDGYSEMRKELQQIEDLVAPYGKYLVELYFRIVHPAYPILHTKVVLEKYSRSYQEFIPPLLAAVYSLSLSWWNYSMTLPISAEKPKCEYELDRIAVRSFNLTMTRPKLSNVQAGLLILQNIRTDEGSWAIMSQVIAMSEELGLHLDCRDWKIPRWERRLRRRIAWAVWVQDKWQALKLWRPSHFSNKDNWMVTDLTDDDFPDKYTEDSEGGDAINGKIIFMLMVSLTQIVSDILQTFYSPRAVSEITDTMEILALARPLQERLKEWYRSLPEETKLSNLKSRKFSSSGYLYLAYFAAEITLHRRIIYSLSSSHPAGIQYDEHGNTTQEWLSYSELVVICRTAAMERLYAALEFIRSLRPEHIQAFWHSSSVPNFVLIGSFIALLWNNFEGDVEQQKSLENCMRDYIWMLKVASVGSEQILSSIKHLERVASFLPFHSSKDPVSLMDSSDSEYSEE